MGVLGPAATAVPRHLRIVFAQELRYALAGFQPKGEGVMEPVGRICWDCGSLGLKPEGGCEGCPFCKSHSHVQVDVMRWDTDVGSGYCQGSTGAAVNFVVQCLQSLPPSWGSALARCMADRAES